MNDITPVRLIVGLGNPGSEYSQTRHNAGFWLVDEVLRRFSSGTPLTEETKFHGLTGQILIGSQMCRLLIPNTFMNRSGLSVAALANFYKIEPEAILVAHDELDIAPGTVRLKVGGGHGGHNGLRDIISSLGNQKQFARLRIGIGHPGNAKQVSNYVLKKAPSKEQQWIEDSVQEAASHIEKIVSGDWQAVMNQMHKFNAAEEL
jgi:PTH1 family peptidyl-tRNA hydrolase